MYDPASRGQDTSLPGSFRRLAGDVLTALGQRLELVSVEVRLAQRRAVLFAAAGIAATFVLLVALMLLTAGFVLYMWPDDVVKALLIAGGAYAVLGLIATLVAASALRSRPAPMESLLEVLKEDREWILGRRPD
jgi:uncharacterized membrane protein YqjE